MGQSYSGVYSRTCSQHSRTTKNLYRTSYCTFHRTISYFVLELSYYPLSYCESFSYFAFSYYDQIVLYKKQANHGRSQHIHAVRTEQGKDQCRTSYYINMTSAIFQKTSDMRNLPTHNKMNIHARNVIMGKQSWKFGSFRVERKRKFLDLYDWDF